MVACVYNPVLGRQTQKDPWGSLPDHLAYLVSSKPVRDPVSV